MTNEQLLTLIASILIPLGSLILVQAHAIRSELREAARECTELRNQIGDLLKHVDTQIGELRERMAHLEGLLEGLREAITRQPVS